MTGKYLITTDDWFTATDGQHYKAAWGEVNIVDDTVLGIKTNRLSSNWFAKVGTEENHILIAGCQIHYAIKAEQEPNTKDVTTWEMSATDFNNSTIPTRIFIFK